MTMMGRGSCILVVVFLGVAGGTAANGAAVLLIGDSLTCGPFGDTLVGQYTERGDQVDAYCAVSSVAAHWLRGYNPRGVSCMHMSSRERTRKRCANDGRIPTLASLLNTGTYDQVVIALGTNSLDDPNVDSFYATLAAVGEAGTDACAWIGPPHLRPDQSRGFPTGSLQILERNLPAFYVSLARAVVSSCRLVDSRAPTTVGTPGGETLDGVHRGTTAGRYWAENLP